MSHGDESSLSDASTVSPLGTLDDVPPSPRLRAIERVQTWRVVAAYTRSPSKAISSSVTFATGTFIATAILRATLGSRLMPGLRSTGWQEHESVER